MSVAMPPPSIYLIRQYYIILTILKKESIMNKKEEKMTLMKRSGGSSESLRKGHIGQYVSNELDDKFRCSLHVLLFPYSFKSAAPPIR